MNFNLVDNLEDIKNYMNKYNNYFLHPLNVNEIKIISKKFHDFGIMYIAEENGIDLGYIAGYMNNKKTKIAYISQLVVDLNKRKQGVGKFLINNFQKESFRKKMRIVELETYKDNKIAIRFYEKNGFCKEKLIENKIWRMSKKLEEIKKNNDN